MPPSLLMACSLFPSLFVRSSAVSHSCDPAISLVVPSFAALDLQAAHPSQQQNVTAVYGIRPVFIIIALISFTAF